ncbi:MAG: hypothetical protein KAW00_04870 [Dehalococcoidia bacterium]|nr:hypothetical protein [Dehalococcoidia bacterium]
MTEGVDGETLYHKEIAGVPGRTLLELFPRKIWRSQSTIFRYNSRLEHARPNLSTGQCGSWIGETGLFKTVGRPRRSVKEIFLST